MFNLVGVSPWVIEAYVFGGFLTVAAASWFLKAYAQHRRVAGFSPCWLAKHTLKWVFFITPAVAHPVTVGAIKEYTVHVIVYSGYVLKTGH